MWGIPFVVIGLYFVLGRFFYKAYRKRRTLYAVTNRRVMSIVQRSGGKGVEATYLRAIPNISTSAESDGRGSVVFGNSSPFGGWYANTGMEFFARGTSRTQASASTTSKILAVSPTSVNSCERTIAASQRIAVVEPDWTDFSEHDPGVTLVELLAYTAELLAYLADEVARADEKRLRRRRFLALAAASSVLVFVSCKRTSGGGESRSPPP